MGPETGKEGIWEKGLPWMMEEVLEQWDKAKHFAKFKAEHPIHYGLTEVLEKAAKINAQRLKMSKSETNLLISRFSGYTKELSGLGVKPLPPLLYGIVDRSRDHTLFNYNNILIPELMRINPSPKYTLFNIRPVCMVI